MYGAWKTFCMVVQYSLDANGLDVFKLYRKGSQLPRNGVIGIWDSRKIYRIHMQSP